MQELADDECAELGSYVVGKRDVSFRQRVDVDEGGEVCV